MSDGKIRKPGGAMAAVISESPEGLRYLLLHNADYLPGQPDGDWSWGPPSGCREPFDADIAACAARELFEETGISGEPVPVITEDIDWAIFYLRVPWGTAVRLDPAEHNDYAWCTVEEATRRCRPERLAESFRHAVAATRQSPTCQNESTL
ncbi:NUDIX domain-containing protein [Microlunatus speluncae]|uniref:NUDIX domain-containing protein n=1 Tax=Microlunatus speluncae TaxID=2594267 RepID=UPI00126628D8|nr:NUDIX domain-containing protein [Microlunatus speluncae]